MTNTSVGMWTKVQYHALLWGCRIIGFLPSWFLYNVVAEVVYVVVYYIVGYRKGVVRTNLANSFPSRSAEELRRIEKGYYHHLSELFIDTIELVSISPKKIVERYKITNLDEVEAAEKGRDWMMALAHFGNWECLSGYRLVAKNNHEFAVVYKPLSNTAFDMFYLHVRERFGSVAVPMAATLRHIVSAKQQGKPVILGLIADQTPLGRHINHWYEFLHQPTPFFNGIEKMSTRFGMPVYFLHTRKVAKGHYEAYLECIYDGVESVEEFEITTRYAASLERMIEESPEIWLWSHRRWKRKPKTTNNAV